MDFARNPVRRRSVATHFKTASQGDLLRFGNTGEFHYRLLTWLLLVDFAINPRSDTDGILPRFNRFYDPFIRQADAFLTTNPG